MEFTASAAYVTEIYIEDLAILGNVIEVCKVYYDMTGTA